MATTSKTAASGSATVAAVTWAGRAGVANPFAAVSAGAVIPLFEESVLGELLGVTFRIGLFDFLPVFTLNPVFDFTAGFAAAA